MQKTHKLLLNLAASFAFLGLASGAFAAEAVDKKDLKLKNLAQLEESAKTPADHKRLAHLYSLRADMLQEKVVRHGKLEKRYAAAPKSLLAKRGSGWNTPKRQRQLAETARKQAADARQMSATYLARAGSSAVVTD